MYEFHYNYIGVKYGCGAKTVKDTDNLIYRTESDDVYEEFYKYKSLFNLAITQ